MVAVSDWSGFYIGADAGTLLMDLHLAF